MTATTSGDVESMVTAIERLSRIFDLERKFYLAATSAAFIVVLVAAARIMLAGKADPASITSLSGSGGAIAYTGGRVLHMWDTAIALISPVKLTDKQKEVA